MKKNIKHEKKIPPYQNKTTLTVYLVLRALVIFVLVRAALRRDFESVFMCSLTLVLMILPSFFSRKLNVELPTTLEVIILLFIFAAEILGELNSFYIRVPHWDTMLHTINGFLCAAIGFALVDLLNESEHFSFKLSPVYLAIVAFCFSMTVGVMWEFFEYTGDRVMKLDMQKDTVVNAITSVMLDPTNSNIPVTIDGITSVTINGQELGLGGYLDIGLYDTMGDLFVNFIGAVVFSTIGYFYIKQRGKGKLAAALIPVVLDPEKEKSKKDEQNREPNDE